MLQLARRVLWISLGALCVSGCEYCVAGAVMCADFREECDPATFESACPDPHTTRNCMSEQKAGCRVRWYEQTWACEAPNECRVLEGVAECVSLPVESCDATPGRGGTWPTRCVGGALHRCLPGELDSVEFDWESARGYWRDADEACPP